MALKVKLLLIICISALALGNPAFLRFPEDYTEIVSRQQLPRLKRSMTTICVEIRPSSSQEEPYYMCKGANVPKVKNENPRVNFERREVSNVYNPPPRSEPYVGFRAPTQDYTQQPRTQFFPFEPQFHVPQERSFLSFSKQQEDEASFNPQYYSLYENPPSEASVVPRAYGNDAFPFGLGTQSADIFDRTNVYQQATAAPPAPLVQNNLVSPSYYKPFGRNAGIGSFPKTSDSEVRPFEQGVLPVNQVFTSDRNLANPLQYNSYSPHEITDEFINFQNYQNKPPLDLPNLMQPRSIPSEYMNDPILRAFYNSLIDSSFPDKISQTTPMHSSSLTNTNGYISENKAPLNPKKSQTPTHVTQQYAVDELPTTTLPPQNTCSTCPTTKSQAPSRTSTANSEDDLLHAQVSTYRNGKSCPHQDLNWPPLVIAMPCCGQQTNAQSMHNVAPVQNAFNTPQMAFGFTPNFMIPMTPITPNWNTMPNDMARARTSEVNVDNIGTTNLPELKDIVSVTEHISREVKESIDETTMPVTAVIETTIAAEEVIKLSDSSDEQRQDSEEINSSTEPSFGNISSDVTTTILGLTETTDQISDKQENNPEIQKSFKDMLKSAKKFSELANEGVRSPTEMVIHRKKGKRHEKIYETNLNPNSGRTNNNYRRQYASMLR